MKNYDAVIIGFGKGGKTLAGALANQGKQVALIEKSKQMYGGTCINVACIPTKALKEQSLLSYKLGGSFEEKSERYEEAINRKDALTTKLRNKNYHMLADRDNVIVYDGVASFVDEHIIKISDDNGSEEIFGSEIFINTGSRPFIAPVEGLAASKHMYVSETLLDLKKLPAHLVIIGGGYIGLEFAMIYSGFGSSVTIIQDGDKFIPREDGEVAEAVYQTMSDRGIRIIKNAKITKVNEMADKSEIVYTQNDEGQSLLADAILVATGRRPNVAQLELENANVELTPRGAIKVDEHLRTNIEHIYAMGDVVGGLQFTYISLDDQRIVKSTLANDNKRTTLNRGNVPYTVFIDPPLSRVGMSEEEAVNAGYEIKIARLSPLNIPKAAILGQQAGLLKVIINAADDTILGAHLFCIESQEMINIFKLAMDAKIPYQVLRDNVYNHPTMSESINDLLNNIA